MSLKRYKQLSRYIHVVDNTTKEALEHKDDKLFKIRPVIEMIVRENCVKIEPEEVHSIDEQIIPAKTKTSRIRQYNPKKPKKWGFKMFVPVGQSGFMYDFFLYSGKDSTKRTDSSCENVILCLCEKLPCQLNYKFSFDNWFCTLPLMLKMKSLGILTTSTVRANRLMDCSLKTKKDLKVEGRGSTSFKTDANSGIMLLRWFDNRSVQLTSTCGTVKRWEPNSKKHVQVPCPAIVKEYNAGMGGVDLVDMVISLYRSLMKCKRWYLKVLVHCVDICKVNGWLLYRRHANQISISRKKRMPHYVSVPKSLTDC